MLPTSAVVWLYVRITHLRRSLQATEAQLSTLVFPDGTVKWATLEIEIKNVK